MQPLRSGHGMACERVQYRGEEEAADMATYDADLR